jgi:low temperature requirement protein LtrA
VTLSPKGQFKRWLSSPPRPHGDIIEDRSVSFLELFYDLAYVAVITQVAHRLAEDISVTGVAEFAVVFSMIWIAWFNGSLYVELHGREDGRTRLLVFVQMGLLVLMAVFAEHAADTSGAAFALAYAAFLGLMTWHWYAVRRLDATERPEYMGITAIYVGAMLVSTIAIAATALLAPDLRLVLWAVFSVAWLVGIQLAAIAPRYGMSEAIIPTDSLVERFGLFVIIVLGEVIFGVVGGLSAAEVDVKTITTGSLALIVGFGIWWIYFDLVGRRLPRRDRGTISLWMLSHVPITGGIVAVGAGMVSLIEHAHDPVSPPATAWLISGATALTLLALIVTERSLADAVRLASVYRPLTLALAAGASVALFAGWAAPAPWVLALLLVAILTVLWFFAVAWMIRAGAWGAPPTEAPVEVS